MELKKELETLVAEAKKEMDRLAERRQEELGNGINYVENEMQIEHLKGEIEGLQEAIDRLA